MEPVVYDETPLADYLKDGGDGSDVDWAAVDSSPPRPSSSSRCGSSPPPSPSPFAPTGRPLVKARFRGGAAPSAMPGAIRPAASRSSTLRTIRRNCSAAVVASIDRADNAKFLEQFRYTIVASQLLSGHSVVGHRAAAPPKPSTATTNTTESNQTLLSTEGIAASILGALAVAVVLSWFRSSTKSYVTRKRLALLVALLAASGFVGQVYMKRQWLRYRREQSLSEMVAFVANSHDFDSATEATLSLVQEVELVSRGYRITAPLPPISRLEDRSQSRKCVRLRRALRNALGDSLKTYIHISSVVRGFSEQTELEKYYDMYDVSDLDMSDALQGFSEEEFDDPESLRTLKILAARFHTTRKMVLCALLAFDANGESTDLLRWSTAVESLRRLNVTTKESYARMQSILSEEESFPVPATPKIPLTPNRERWRSQLRKLNSLSTGIRGLQAKLHLLREESDRALDDSNDVSELGPNLMSQYESIGVDLKELMAAWEEGKAALALGIDRNEKRLSSMSTALSPTTSLSGLTTVGEGGTADALKALTGESPPSSEAPEPDTPEVFEAVALPRPRSLLTREERITKMRDEREQKALARQQMDATRGMLRELETVINLRPRSRTSAPASARDSL
ncbi:proliferating cell nuclear antigen [Purpureocillium lavendulum]|uniref:Vezatin n=1 Tax=Purpureocillium lavendulum TaxID=1247861 RepID=A0AB34G349_9HYPO|nr:proliferating cell nuclear antigen [Purpureocillium lavendulum]